MSSSSRRVKGKGKTLKREIFNDQRDNSCPDNAQTRRSWQWLHNHSLVNTYNENESLRGACLPPLLLVLGAGCLAICLSFPIYLSISLSFYAVSYSVCGRKIRHGTRRSNAVPWSASWEVFIVGYPRSWESGLFIGHSPLSLFLPFPPSPSPTAISLLFPGPMSLSLSLSLCLSLFLTSSSYPFVTPSLPPLSFHLSSLPLSPRPGFVHDTDFLRYYVGIQGVLSNDPYPILAFSKTILLSFISFWFFFSFLFSLFLFFFLISLIEMGRR